MDGWIISYFINLMYALFIFLAFAIDRIIFMACIGVWVHFEADFLLDYGDVLQYMYKTALSWAYESETPLPKEDLEGVLKNYKNVDFNSFISYFYLWRFVSTRMPSPIPVLKHIVPSVVSHWNAIKGGSETITKLILLNKYDPPSNSTQARAIGRMLLLGSVIIHRVNQIITSKEAEKYPSLKHFRNAANERFSFHETLLSMVHGIRFQNFQPGPGVLSSSSIFNTTGTFTRTTDRRTKTVEWGSVPTGKTPHKNVKIFYDRDPTSYSGLEMEVHVRHKECLGKPAYRVISTTKSPKGAGSRNNCAECHKITNFFVLGAGNGCAVHNLQQTETLIIGSNQIHRTLALVSKRRITQRKKSCVQSFRVITNPMKQLG